MDPLIGRVVGKYKIIELVAAGGMGRIYRAEQMPLGRTVALKVLTSQGPEGEDPTFKKRFLREASILARLQHPNIVTLFDYGAIEGTSPERFFMSMEFLSGQTLTRRIAERGTLPVSETVRLARQIASGLAEAHAQGVVHRDLKPSNIIVLPGRDGEELVKILDFGIVKILDEEHETEEEITREGSFVGSPRYMSPEQIARSREVDVRSDIYSFGIILYQCLTGSVPFDAASSVQTLMAHLSQPPPPIRNKSPLVPDWLERLVMSCIEKEPENRPQSMSLVAKVLSEGATFSSAGVSTKSLMDELSWRRARKLPAIVFGGAVLILAVGGAIGFYAMSSRSHPAAAGARSSASGDPSGAPRSPARVSLRIESNPSGADVRDAHTFLGSTPLDVWIDNDQARRVPLSFTITKDGFEPYSITQGPSDAAVRLVANLTTVPTPDSASTAPTSAQPHPHPTWQAPHPPPPRPKQDDDIPSLR